MLICRRFRRLNSRTAASVGAGNSNGRCCTAASPVRPGKRWRSAESYWNVRDIEALVFEVLVCRVEVRVEMVASCAVSVLSMAVVVEKSCMRAGGEEALRCRCSFEGMGMKQEECGRREDKRAAERESERRSWEAGWAGLRAGSGVVGEIPRSVCGRYSCCPGCRPVVLAQVDIVWAGGRPTATAGAGTPKPAVRKGRWMLRTDLDAEGRGSCCRCESQRACGLQL